MCQQLDTTLDAAQRELGPQTATGHPSLTENFSPQKRCLNFGTESDALRANFTGANGHLQSSGSCRSGEFIPRGWAIFRENLIDRSPNFLTGHRIIGVAATERGPEWCLHENRAAFYIRKSRRQSKADAKRIAQRGSVRRQGRL